MWHVCVRIICSGVLSLLQLGYLKLGGLTAAMLCSNCGAVGSALVVVFVFVGVGLALAVVLGHLKEVRGCQPRAYYAAAAAAPLITSWQLVG
jgi:hypothetical protein